MFHFLSLMSLLIAISKKINNDLESYKTLSIHIMCPCSGEIEALCELVS